MIGIKSIAKIFQVKFHLNILTHKVLLPSALLFIKKTPNDFPEVSSMHMKNVWWPYKLLLFYKIKVGNEILCILTVQR